MSMSHLYWGAQDRTQHSSCVLSSAEWKEKDLYSTLPASLVQPRAPLAFFATRALCWLTFDLVSTRSPGSLYAKVLSSRVTPSTFLVHRVVLSQVQDFVLPVVELCEVKDSVHDLHKFNTAQPGNYFQVYVSSSIWLPFSVSKC